VHIIPGALFFLLAPLQFVPGMRAKHLRLHRWLGRILVISGLVIGVSALVMSFTMNIGGANETAATTLFGTLFLFCLIKAYRHIRRKEVAQHREWMIRAFGIALGVAATRPVVGMFFAFRRLTPHEFFGIAFWIGFTITFFAAEAWIDYTRERPIPGTQWTPPRRPEWMGSLSQVAQELPSGIFVSGKHLIQIDVTQVPRHGFAEDLAKICS
jgi:uncharacterized membrane protein